jgi:hypothetical protein
MRKILFIFCFSWALMTQAQIQGYNDIGLMMTTQNKQSTARMLSMKGAFGALGGDLSALSLNPAGAAVFTYSAASATLGYSDQDLIADFYGTSISNNQENLNLSQFGGVIIFENDYSDSELNKLAFGINYNLLNDYKNSWISEGISHPTWDVNYFSLADNNLYTNVESQKYTNISSGNQSELNFSLAADIEDQWFLGLSFNAYDFEFIEDATRLEFANDGNGHTVDAFESFWQEVKGEGFSLGAGIILKPTHNFRLGISYTSPVWYEMHEDSNMFAENEDDYVGYYDVLYSVDPPSYYNSDDKILSYDYHMRTPSKLTGSMAIIFGKSGLISADITRQNYKGIHIGPNYEFSDENEIFDNKLQNTFSYNIGTEWRLDFISIRAGYGFEQNPYIEEMQNPYIDDPYTNYFQSYALGLGFNFGEYNFDIAYDYSEKTGYYDFYPEFNNINGAELMKTNNKFLATLTYKF